MSVTKNGLMEKGPCSSSSTEAYVSSLGVLGALGKSPPPPPSSRGGGSEVGDEENNPSPLEKEKEKEKNAQEEEEESVVAEFGFGGVLHKWTNIGKGWRPRWFTLRHGVLSYYRACKLSLRQQDLRGVTVIGQESKKLMKKQQQRRIHRRPNKLLGELHLQVSSIKKSESDDRRFCIYTGTKKLHLRAESREDRSTWLDALYAAKEHFPSPSSYMKDLPEFQISTKKLEAFLEKEGVSQDAIRECEAIMREEFSILQDHIRSLQQKQKFLVDSLRTLAAEKVELENTVMSARRRNEPCMNVSGAIEGGIETESDNEKRSQSGVDIETDDNDIFFDTSESLSRSGSMSQITSDEFAGDCIRPELKPATSPEHRNNVEITGFNYPNVQRRKRLPEPREIEKGVSLWSIIKDNIGKDLTRICLPVYFNEPLSSLQRCFEDLEYSNLLDRASEWGKKGNHLMRILNVAAFAVSGYSSTVGRTCKPFNPLLGETYEADYPDKGLHFFSEKVSHHPMIVACHCQGNGWVFWGDCNLKSRFWGHSVQLDPVGILTLRFDDGETFFWSKVTSSIHNIIIGKPYCHHSGTMKIQGNKGFSCKIQFKEHSVIERNPRQVQGFVNDSMGKKIATLFGKWDGSMYYMLGDILKKPRGFEPMSEAVPLWTRNDPPELPTRYNLTAFAITLNESTPELKEKLPLTDSRMRPDQRHLENGDFDQANAEKLRLEQKQREARKLQENGWKPLWFAQGKEGGQFEYIGGYWEARERGDWRRCPDIFGIGKK